MIQTQKKREILRKTKPKTTPEFREFSLINSLKSSARFVLLYKKVFLLWCFVNFLFLYVFHIIPNGWTNSLSIVWLVAYYVYWCIFMRQIQQHKPYFSLIRIFNGLIPASKIMFINICIYIFITITPFIPLLMGFRGKYLEFFEQYMEIMESYDSLTGKTFFYLFMLIISPLTLMRPYLAWISSLVGKSRSIIDAYKKTKGNYFKFIECAATMSIIFEISYYIDTIYNINTLMLIMSVLSVYFNIVFIHIYKSFYQRQASTKTLKK